MLDQHMLFVIYIRILKDDNPIEDLMRLLQGYSPSTKTGWIEDFNSRLNKYVL